MSFLLCRHSLMGVGFLILISLLLWPITTVAGEVVLSNAGNGQWQLTFSGLANTHGIDLDLRYDAVRLPNAGVTVGSGVGSALSALNDKSPGTIRLGVVSTQSLPESGLLLTIKSPTANGELSVSRLDVKAIDGQGKSIAVTTRQQLASTPSPSTPPSNPPDPIPTPTTIQPDTTNTPTAIGATSRSSGGAASGSVKLPDPFTAPTTKRSTASTAGSTPPMPITKAGIPFSPPQASLTSALAGPEKRYHSQEEIVSAIERLPRPWSVKAIKDLFLREPTEKSVRQEPRVVLADGVSRVKLFLPKRLSNQKPSLAVQGCTLGSVWDAKELGWQIDLTTQRGIWPATVILMGEKDLIKFPVVIVPKLTLTTTHDQAGSMPQLDFDGDGKATATDAYLYVGNLLVEDSGASN